MSDKSEKEAHLAEKRAANANRRKAKQQAANKAKTNEIDKAIESLAPLFKTETVALTEPTSLYQKFWDFCADGAGNDTKTAAKFAGIWAKYMQIGIALKKEPLSPAIVSAARNYALTSFSSQGHGITNEQIVIAEKLLISSWKHGDAFAKVSNFDQHSTTNIKTVPFKTINAIEKTNNRQKY